MIVQVCFAVPWIQNLELCVHSLDIYGSAVFNDSESILILIALKVKTVILQSHENSLKK